MEKQNHPHSQHASEPHGFAWAQWEYDLDEWAVFDQVDWWSVRSKSWLILILSPIIFLVIMMVLWILSAPSAVSVPAFIILLTALFVLMVTTASILRRAKKRYRARHNPAESHRRVTLARDGIWLSGTYFPFSAGRWHLESVDVTANPTVLHVKLRLSPSPNQGYSELSHIQRFHIPVPRGHEAEAEQLRQRYYAEVIRSGKKPADPPEPSL